MNQLSVMGMMKTIVPITRFNKGEANKIFDEVETSGTKIVMKNNKPACVLLSPAQYESLMEMLSDYLLYSEAEKRTASNKDEDNISHEDMMQELGISRESLDEVDVEIE
ncbi:MAG: type II toxin-antitoxin system Phd/YefM family antitoxin [Acutalibacteraceae bacterium]